MNVFKIVDTPIDGRTRAAERLAAKREGNLAIPDLPVYTRQQSRAELRSLMKQLRGQRKVYAMKTKQRGGAAVVV